jgi:Polysaccharide lyase
LIRIRKSLKATVYPDDLAGGSGARAEVVHFDRAMNTYYTFSDGDDVEYKWYTKFPADLPMKMKNTFHVVTQWHQREDISQCYRNNQLIDCPSVPLLLNLRDYDNDGDPTLELLVINKENGNFFDSLWQIELTKTDLDRWHEFRLHTKWSGCDEYDE